LQKFNFNKVGLAACGPTAQTRMRSIRPPA